MSFWESIRIGASGLLAQRLRLDVIANNIANAQTTRTAEGGPYRRKDVIFTTQNNGTFGQAPVTQRGDRLPLAGGVKVAAIVTDNQPGNTVYDPTHPDADAQGFVSYPNVNPVVEMTNMLSATRSYEANLSTIEAAKRMALKALDIGR